MPPHNDPAPEATLSKALSRRSMLEGLGALAATVACSSGETPESNTAGTSGTGGSSGSGAGAGSGNAALAGKGGQSPTGSGGGAGAGTGPTAAGTSSTSGGAGAGGQAPAAGSGGAGTSGASPAGGAGAGGQPAASGAAGAGASGAPSAGAGAGGGSAGTSGGGLLSSPPWDDVPLTAMCTKTSATDGAGQGPFFIHELEKSDDISLVRQDIRGQYNESALPGVEMHLHLRILDATAADDCENKPLEGVDVYIWHTDAQGYYSGFGKRGTSTEQKPDTKYAGSPNSGNLENTDRFLRGVQTTDANGVVSFRSVFPGWYNGRALHIHFVAFKSGSMPASTRVEYNDSNSGNKWLFTTQFYFDPEFSHAIHEKNEPYKARTSIAAYNDALAAAEQGNSKLHFTASLSGDTDGVGGIVTAQMQVLLNPKT